MKKLILFAFITLFATACKDYNHTEYKTSTNGIELKIDSSKFQHVLLKVDESYPDRLIIVDEKGIKEINTQEFIAVVAGFVVGALIVFLLCRNNRY